MKILWLDCETGGLDSRINDILTLACLIEIDGEVKDSLYLQIQPFNWDKLDKQALEINGLTIEQLKTFDTPQVAHKKLISFLEKYVDRYNKLDKFLPAGYNVGFDCDFLASQFKKVGDKYFGAWVDYHKLDVASLVHLLQFKKVLNLAGYKLVNVAKEFNIAIEAHNAMSDIKATRELFYKILDRIEIK